LEELKRHSKVYGKKGWISQGAVGRRRRVGIEPGNLP